MEPLTAARAQMEVSLGFHMIFSAIGIALPVFMCAAEGLGLRTGKPHWMQIARSWGKATSLLFAVGAVSGTALSFELGLLWPRFMQMAGPTIGSAFALEGYAFFVEAIFIGLYLYGWDRLSPRAHWACGGVVAASGTASGALVIAANAWMQVPVGTHPLAPFESPVWFPMALHTTIASLTAVGLAIAGVYAAAVLRGKDDAYHRSALKLGVGVAAVCSIVQLASGDVSARAVAHWQPAKLAAMEQLETTRDHAPLTLGPGLVEIPSGLSLLVAHEPGAVVTGLDRVPADERPPIGLVHEAFDLMVACGMGAIALSLVWAFVAWRRRAWSKWLLRATVAASPLGFVAIEAGWIVAEAGRQPWTVGHVLRTRDAVTPVAGVEATFWAFVLLYVCLGSALVYFLRKQARA